MNATLPTSESIGTGDFRHRAACRGVEPELFFPVAERGREHDVQVAAAKTVCGQCEVRPECLTWALRALPYGVAGGLTETERRRERAHRGAARRARRVPHRPAGGTQAEVAAAGREALRAGLTVQEVAREFGVSERTAFRWVDQAHTTTSTTARAVAGAEGSHGCNRAPLLTSHAHNPLAETRAPEGIRS